MLLGTVTGLFFALALLGVPIVWALLGTAVVTNRTLDFPYPDQALMVNFIGGVEPFHLVAVPLFILAGEIIGRGGVGARMIAFARTLVGWLPGGLGVVTVVACMMFGAVSGSAIATAAAIGTVMAPGMAAAGYRPAFTGALIATAGTLGVIVPPSIPMLVFGFVANVSVAELFIAGILPALCFGGALMAVCMWEGRRTGCDPGGRPSSGAEIVASFKDCAPALSMPVIILGGIYSGIFTPTEAAAIATAAALLVAVG
jgi:C4-dicarboxylate transporter DctM subunit